MAKNGVSHIMLVEDSEEDAFFFRHAVTKSRVPLTVSHLRSVPDAIAYMEAMDPYSDRAIHPFPDLIFTDLKMPLQDGFEFIQWLRAHPHCATVPTIVLSSSYIDADIERAYKLGANAFLSKPNSVQELEALLKVAYPFWSKTLWLPHPATAKC